MDIWGFLLTEILRALLPIVITAAVAGIALWLRKERAAIDAWLHTKLSAEQYNFVYDIARVAVNMVEQIARNPEIQAYGEAKKRLAEEYIQSQLDKYGIRLSAEEISALIEAAVRAEINRDK